MIHRMSVTLGAEDRKECLLAEPEAEMFSE